MDGNRSTERYGGPEWHPRTTGGLRDADHAEAFHAARRRYWADGGPPRCGATTKHGEPCRAAVRRLGEKCPHHAPVASQRQRRRRLLGDEAASLSPAHLHRRLVRVAANRLRVTWARDPWAPGLTLDLDAYETAFRDALAAAGWPIGHIPYATADWARWKWRRAFLDGRHLPDVWREAVAALPARIAKAGPPPDRWAWVEPAAPGGMAYVLPARLSPDSKRRRLDPPRVPRQPAPPMPMADADTLRALAVLREHGDALAPALAVARTEDARLRLALAFARLRAGEIDHLDWIDALAAAKAGG